MDIKDRILDFLKYKNMTIAEFERNVDLANGYIKKFKGSIGSDKINNIVSYYPELNIEWLIIGKGSMLKPEVSVTTNPQQSNNKNVIKYYPSVSGSMGGIEFMDNPEEASMDIILPGFSECKYAINAYGDSMYPVIKSGQVVLLMEWTERFIDWGRIYLVVTKSGYRAIKYLMPSDSNSSIKCESENKEASPAFEIEKEDILKLYLVKGWVCRDTI